MDFTYMAYEKLMQQLSNNGYAFANYIDYINFEHPVILRHDIDYDISKAVKLAEHEKTLGVKSTYFVLITSDLYNAFSKETYDGLMKIVDCGHEIGLHFDETRYIDCELNVQMLAERILEEKKLLEKIIGKTVDVVSMHRPSEKLLETGLDIPGMINSYSYTFFKTFKYLSDSRRRWREPVEEIIEARKYPRLHILTHAFWYNEIEKDIYGSVSDFINSGNVSRYRWMESNITELNTIMKPEEVVRVI